MLYNSVEQFLAAHEAALIALMEDAQAAVGGSYAGLPAADQQAHAQGIARGALQVLTTGSLDGVAVQVYLRRLVGVLTPADLTRTAQEWERRVADFLAVTLREQPALERELARRMRYAIARYLSQIQAVQLDAALIQLGGVAPARVTVGQWLAAEEASLEQVLVAAQRAAGGHYTSGTAAEQAARAATDARDFIAALTNDMVDHAALQRTVASVPDSAMLADLQRMVAALEPLALAWVQQRPAMPPAIAQETARRIRHVILRFQVALQTEALARRVPVG